MKHHTPAELNAAHAAHPDCWICEIVTRHYSALVAVPSTPANAERVVRSGPLELTGDMLDGASITSTH